MLDAEKMAAGLQGCANVKFENILENKIKITIPVSILFTTICREMIDIRKRNFFWSFKTKNYFFLKLYFKNGLQNYSIRKINLSPRDSFRSSRSGKGLSN